MGFRKPRTKLTCPICKKVFSLPESEYTRRSSRTDHPLVCSSKCSGKQKSKYHNGLPYIVAHSGKGKGSRHIPIPAEVVVSDRYTLEVRPGGVLVYTPVITMGGQVQ